MQGKAALAGGLGPFSVLRLSRRVCSATPAPALPRLERRENCLTRTPLLPSPVQDPSVTRRVLDIHQFMNSKVLFKFFRYSNEFKTFTPVMVHVNYHSSTCLPVDEGFLVGEERGRGATGQAKVASDEAEAHDAPRQHLHTLATPV